MVVRSIGVSSGGQSLQRCNRRAVAVPLSTGGNRVTVQQHHPAVGQGAGVHRSTPHPRVGGAKLSWADPPSQGRGADMQHGTEPPCGRRRVVLIYSPQRSPEWTGSADGNRERWTRKRMRKRKKTQDTGSHTPA